MAVIPPTPPNTKDVSVTGLEDQSSITIPLSGTDVDGTVTQFRIVVTLPDHGVLKDGNGNVLQVGSLVPATGNAANIYFTPDHDWNGVTTFQYAARDNSGLQDATPATVTINVTPVNDPPNTNDTSASGLEDAASIAVHLSGSDVDGTVTKFTISDLPANGVLKDGNGNVLHAGDTVTATNGAVDVYFTPGKDWNGQTTFHYAAQDDSGANDATPATATITVTPVNDPPETNDVSGTGQEDTPVSVVLTGSDIDGTVAKFTITDLPANGVLKDGNGNVLHVGDTVAASGNQATVTFVPNADWNGQTSFHYASQDDSGANDATPATATITVTPVNDPPDTKDTSGSGAEDTPIPLTLSGSDIDGSVSSFRIVDLPANGVLKDGNGNVLHVGDTVAATGGSANVTFVPNQDWNGQNTFHFAAVDDQGLADPTPATATVTVTPVNDPPDTNNASGSGPEDGGPITVHLTGSDVDGTVVKFTINSLPDGGVLKDSGGNVLHVGDTVTATGNAADVTFTPGADWNGQTTFNYASQDDQGLNDPTPGTATITVTPVNDPPETQDTASSGDEDTVVSVSLMGSDIDGTVTSFTISSLPANGYLTDGGGNVLKVGDSVAASGNGATVYFHPDANWNGDTDFDYASKDDQGLVDATPATATITVNPVNDPPATDDTSASGQEDAASIAVNLSGSDVDGTVAKFTITDLPANGILKDGNGNVLHVGDTVPASGNGATVFFTPNADWNGQTNFHYAAQDDAGANDPTPATATINVAAVNDPPTTDDTHATGQEDAASIAVSLHGADVDGTVASFTINSLPGNGVLKDGNGNVLHVGDTVPASGGGATVYFTPDSNWNGDTSFQYASKDDQGASDPTPGTASITVTSVNDPPDTNNTSAAGQEDAASIQVDLSGSDVDGTVSSFTIKDLPVNGVLKDGNGNVLHVGDSVPATGGQASVFFTPNANWNGDTSFHYASKDDQGAEDPTPATASINVAAVNDPPDTASVTASGQEDAASITVHLSGSDVDGTVSSFTINSLPANGVLKDGNGKVLNVGDSVPASGNGADVYFTPNANWNGQTTFDYASKDNQGLDDPTPGTATINVASVNDGPDTNNAAATGVKGAVNIGLTMTGSDIDGTVTSFTIKSLPTNGTLTDGHGHTYAVGETVTATNGQADIFFTPNSTFTGVVTFQYASNDNDGAQDPTPATGTITIKDNPGAPGGTPPETNNTSATGNEDGGPILINLSGSDSDGTVSSFTINSLPTNGVLKDANGNVLSVGSTVTATGNAAKVYFTPNANWNGDTSFNYASKDNSGLSDATPAKASIHVNPVNDGPETNDVCVSGLSCGGDVKVTLSGTDIDGKVVSFTITSVPNDGTLKDAAGHTLTVGSVVTASGNQAAVYFTPGRNWDGVSTFTYASKDDQGASDPTPATATIKLHSGNIGPDTVNVSASGAENGGAIAIKLSGTDPDGTVTQFKIGSLPTNGVLKDAGGHVLTSGSVVAASGNAATVYFTPNTNWAGSTSFQYASQDNSGAVDSTPATAKISVTGVATPPETKDVTATGCEDGGAVSICLSGSDSDGKVVSFTINDLPANGVLKDSAGHVLTVGSTVTASNNGATVYFTPNANWNGSTTFHYASKDDSGLSDATPATAKVVISAVNDAPTTNAVTATGTEDGGAVKVVLSGADVDGTVVAFKITSLPANGVFKDASGNTLSVGSVVTATNGQANVFFTPNHDFNGDATFQYAAKDDGGLYDGSPATGKITITAVNDPPDAVNDSSTVTANTTLKLSTSTLLANDTDPDGDKLTVTSVQGASHGTVSLGSDGTVSFTPTTGYTGAASFTYTVSDGHGGTDTATVNIDVKSASSSAPGGIAGPGVHTANWWATTGSVYWDGATDASGVKHGGDLPAGELTYKIDSTVCGTPDSNKFLLIGDFNKDGVTDNGEHTFLISLSDAKALLTSSSTDERVVVGRDVVTAWLNYLAGNPVGTVANASAPAWFVEEAVDWLSKLAGTTKTLSHGVVDTGAMSNGAFLGAAVSSSSSAWTTGFNLDGVSGVQSAGVDIAAGSYLHDNLDSFNSVGKIGSTIWANDGL